MSNRKGLNVLSLFDGMSCGQIALNRLGFQIENYFASEIDKYAIKVTQSNYPNTIQLGDVTKIDSVDLPEIDLLIGGSPCQGFSFAGKQLNFSDPRSALFFEFVRLLKELKPKYFFLENVKMKKEYQDVITQYLGVEPVSLNSSLISAGSRPRLYWTNIKGFIMPGDKGIVLKDILLYEVDEKYILSGSHLEWWLKNKDYQIKKKYSALNPEKAICQTARQYASYNGNFVTVGKTLIVKEATKKGYTEIEEGQCFDATFPKSKTRRGRNMLHKCNTLTATNFDYFKFDGDTIRKLTPVECERLQTVPDNYTNHVSDSQRYKMLGNGWTVDAVREFFKHIEQDL